MTDAPQSAIYDDPALIPLYDILNAEDHDHVFYRGEIPSGARHIIDLGCGTGRFALALSRWGYQVTAIDPAPGLVEYAKRQIGADRVRWITGTADNIPGEPPADAVVMMGHAFQCLLTDEAVRDTFRHIHAGLSDTGRFLFESRNPTIAPWSAWKGSRCLTPATLGYELTIDWEVLAVDGTFVTFDEIYHLPERKVTSRSTLRFLDKDAIVNALHAAGFSDIRIYGYWDRRPFAEDSPEIIISAA